MPRCPTCKATVQVITGHSQYDVITHSYEPLAEAVALAVQAIANEHGICGLCEGIVEDEFRHAEMCPMHAWEAARED